MAPMDMPLTLTVELAAVLWGLVAALAISAIALFACTDALDRIGHACAAFVSRARVRFVMGHAFKPRVRNAA